MTSLSTFLYMCQPRTVTLDRGRVETVHEVTYTVLGTKTVERLPPVSYIVRKSQEKHSHDLFIGLPDSPALGHLRVRVKSFRRSLHRKLRNSGLLILRRSTMGRGVRMSCLNWEKGDMRPREKRSG